MSDVPEGYKMCEVGFIPSEWEVKQIKDVCKLINGRGFKPHEWRKEGFPIIRIQNLNGSEEYNYYQGEFSIKIVVEHGQLLFAWSGSRGTSFGPYIWNGQKGLLNYHTWKVNINEANIEKTYFYHALKRLTKKIEEKAHGASALVHTQKWEMEGFKIPLPHTKAEQQAIASALSDVDALITALEQLITKKRNIKQGAMQQLLTGEKRLPGFSGEWEVKKLGEIAEITMGQSPQSAFYNTNGNGIPLIQGNADIEDRKTIIRTYTSSITKKCKKGDIIMSVRAPVGEIAKATFDACLGRGVCAISAKNDYQYHNLIFLEDRWARISKGSTFDSINSTDVIAMEIKMPPTKREQLAIAQILTDMDTEIESLKQKRNKYKAIKQGMMQELLTGKTRLI
jgi:type I restriction enzyme S subunit